MTLMRAFVSTRFGPPRKVLLFETREHIRNPSPKEVQVKVYSAGVNSHDSRVIRGEQCKLRLKVCHVRSPGSELAGVVTVVGRDVSNFVPGDHVMADMTESGFGAFADYVNVPVCYVARLPNDMPFRDASATAVSGLAALQAVKAVFGLTARDNVLVTGASGGVGHLVVQMARHAGARVTAVCRASKAYAAREVGANKVIDEAELRSEMAFTGEREPPFTVVVDTACYNMSGIVRLVREGGRYVIVGGHMRLLRRMSMISGAMQRRYGVKISVLSSKPNANDLNELVGMLTRKEIVPYIDRLFSFRETVDAIEYVEKRKVIGKVVIDFERGWDLN